MTRSGYSDDCEYLALYRASVARATRGKRGQAMFKALLAALDEMPEKKLIANHLVVQPGHVTEGGFCALGALGHKRGLDMEGIDPSERERVARLFKIAPCLAAEVVYENDENFWGSETSAERWTRMRAWVAEQIEKT